MSIVQFIIDKKNIIACDPRGIGGIDIRPDDLIIPPGSLPKDFPTIFTLRHLIDLIGEGNIKLSYYVSASGHVSSHDDWVTYSLNVRGFYYALEKKGSSCIVQSDLVPVAYTEHKPNSPSSIRETWVPLMTDRTSLISGLVSTMECVAGDCGAKFWQYGGWERAAISLKINVIANLTQYYKNRIMPLSQMNQSQPIISQQLGQTDKQLGNVARKISWENFSQASTTNPNDNFFRKYLWIIILVIIIIILIVVVIAMSRDQKMVDIAEYD